MTARDGRLSPPAAAADTLLVGFKRHLRAETVPAEAVYLISERGVTALSGSSVERLAPFLDGTRSVAGLTCEVSPELTESEVGSLLQRLSDAGLLEFRGPSGGDPGAGATGGGDAAAMAFWSLAGLDTAEAARAVGAALVEVIALDGTDPAEAATACAGCGLACREPDPGRDAGATISLVLCEDYLDPRLRAVNATHLSAGRPWLLAKPSGAQAWIGPLFRPGAGPCWACLAKRLEGNRDEAPLLRRVLGTGAFPAAPQAALHATRGAALQLAVGELAKWLAGLRGEQQQAICILDAISLRGRHHPVARRPQCDSCGDPGMVAARAGTPPVLAAVPAGPAGPREVLAHYRHLVDPVTGIVAELRRDERCPAFQHAFVSGRNRAMVASTVAGIKAAWRYHGGGKGITELEARTGALCEAVERYSGTRHGDEATVRGSLRGLGDQAVHPNACMLFGERQFAGRARWNAACAPFHWVPEPFDESAVIDWTPVWSLLTGERRLLPTAMLYYNPCQWRGLRSVMADSNGCAAGASLEDAIVRGFLELVERDAVALWWYNRTRQPAVRLEAFGDPWLAGLPEQYRRLGREIWALDVTSDLGIPVMAAVSRRTGHAGEAIVIGFGAHADPRLALRHALTELGQLLPTAGGAASGGETHGAARWRRATVASQPYLLPQPGQQARTAADYPAAARLDPAGICAIARRCGLDVMVLDQTRPDIGMPVVKVLAPGLRHFWPRFAPGRLFEAPVRLGRLPHPTEYSALNPIPLYV